MLKPPHTRPVFQTPPCFQRVTGILAFWPTLTIGDIKQTRRGLQIIQLGQLCDTGGVLNVVSKRRHQAVGYFSSLPTPLHKKQTPLLDRPLELF